jgi:hypothetical protein
MRKRLEPGSDRWSKEIDRVVARTANRISAELGRMVADLPDGAAPQLAVEFLASELVERERWIMSLIMEDANIREAYAAAVARLPATAARRRKA